MKAAPIIVKYSKSDQAGMALPFRPCDDREPGQYNAKHNHHNQQNQQHQVTASSKRLPYPAEGLDQRGSLLPAEEVVIERLVIIRWLNVSVIRLYCFPRVPKNRNKHPVVAVLGKLVIPVQLGIPDSWK